MSKRFILLLTLFALLPASAHADGRVQFTEENDTFASNDDRHYTQGLVAAWLPGTVEPGDGWNGPFNFLGNYTPFFEIGPNVKRQYEWDVVGQSMFTPQNISNPNPSANDRPYGAWLYTGVGLMQEDQHDSHDTLENAELLAGVVGPFALGGLVQNDFHQFIGVAPARGWTNELHNEPGVMASYERKWRFEAPFDGYLNTDIIPEAGATVGNIFTYGDVGAMIRFGHNLKADYGPSHVRPSLSGTGWFDPDELTDKFGWYVFVGSQGRAVGRNIFLDGNTWRTSPSVDKKTFVADFDAGASVLWSTAIRIDFTVTQRTREFYGQSDKDTFGGLNLVVGF